MPIEIWAGQDSGSIIHWRFPELGLQQTDCHEVRWVQATVFWAENLIGTPTDVLLDKPTEPATFYVQKQVFHVLLHRITFSGFK
ncbi:uclacyanin 1 [Prunus dulcis]|uniref:Uclacyanin 1 n=1 Tax=Prunus dulcis TaxID=3755 RepID=A0A4Y1RAI9_PRUDU|nr:uclacyanin 1 [Prunus dulcis]